MEAYDMYKAAFNYRYGALDEGEKSPIYKAYDNILYVLPFPNYPATNGVHG